jgi:UDP-N-acetylmuramoyl-tripeptide--D-alanyl-D-alanine ligase
MTPLWTSAAIAAATGGAASAAFSASGVAFDSREVGAGDLFIAMKGETTDGHRFLGNAFLQGAAGAITSQPVAHPHVLVADTTSALIMLGAAARQRTAAKIIGVTGSVGKTGTKEALAAALARGTRGHVHRSVKSYNNHTGVPLSLARMPAESAYGVLEMGMNHAGELAALTQLVRPHVAMITAIASAHRAFFNSEAEIAEAKAEIFQGLVSGGTAIIPRDSEHYPALNARAHDHAARVISFGRHAQADVRVLDELPVGNGTLVTAKLCAAELHFTIGLHGAHWVSNALAVLACVEALGADLTAAGLALAQLESFAGRGARHKINVEGGRALIIDESYNANPASMAATLAVLGAEPAQQRIALLGEMRELGETSDALHAGLAMPIIDNKVDVVILVGEAMTPLAKALEGVVEVSHVADAAAALEVVNTRLTAGSALLIKGSNALGLTKIVAALTNGVR